MKTKTAIKLLKTLALDLGYVFVRHAKHGDVYRHPNGHTTSFGGSPSDCNFHRQVIRELRRGTGDTTIAYLNG